ncbi:MAG: sigma-54-dependent Fis family transcriptional regulator [Nitrospiraceae bacterium]|nr:MAG: sigma-54-dependent Fis family transcriptional regulator [Nitrospiraceae bacterium]
MGKILVVEDKDSMARMLKETLEIEGHEVILARDGAEGIKQLRDSNADLVLTDLRLPKKDGFKVLEASKEGNPLRPVIVMTAYGSVETAVSAMKLGAYDFILKPIDTDHLCLIIERSMTNRRLLAENLLLKDALSHTMDMPNIIGKSAKMVKVAQNIQKVSQAKTSVLLLGESGTGKELFARAIHDLSPRKNNAFVAINCAAIPRELLESELFGHEKGAFTGAAGRKLGKFELANKGTIFLDEIGEMDITLQSKVLRAIQEGEIDRVGGTHPVRIDVRIIAASNRDLEAKVKEKSFREDLYYRLSVFPLTIPPLRERKEDIAALAEHFLSKFSAEMNVACREISEEAMEILQQYRWKGNVRELENVIERAMILCEGLNIAPEDLRLSPVGSSGGSLDEIAAEGTLEETAKAALRIAESRRIRKALDDTHGNKTKAAGILSVSYKTLLTKIKDYGI